HSLIASGTTPKLITRENYARPIGYGAMCFEALVAVMALIAACTLEPGVYFAMNVKGEAAATVAKLAALNYPVTVEQMNNLAANLGEQTLFGRTGGAATLAVGMAHIFAKAVNGRWLDLWYHFAIMFEALFILTTLDAGTRVGRYLLQGVLGRLWAPLGPAHNRWSAPLAAALIVGSWGFFLIQGVNDPLGGINSLWPLFGIANQMLAAIALCLGTTLILKKQLAERAAGRAGRPALALVTLVPLVWLLAVTFTAGIEKIAHPDIRIGFLSAARDQADKIAALSAQLTTVSPDKVTDLTANLKKLTAQRRNNLIDAAVAGAFLVMITCLVVVSVRAWCLWLFRRRPVQLTETEPVWLPAYALKESGPNLRSAAGAAAIALGLAKELSGESHFERARLQAACTCACARADDRTIFVAATDAKYNGIRRCC
ncbi:MAG TPA: carbon starvation CstA 5TM domain-containing protein, partial [Verrucomicrobiae bacterium]